jgi:hypothetical protein
MDGHPSSWIERLDFEAERSPIWILALKKTSRRLLLNFPSGQRRPVPGSQPPTYLEVNMLTTPGPTGLYDPRFEHDSCGVSFVAHMKGVRSNDLVRTGLRALTNLEHRGATGAEADSGDGAGILLQVPDKLLRSAVDFDLPEAGSYAVGVVFLPASDAPRENAEAQIEATVTED